MCYNCQPNGNCRCDPCECSRDTNNPKHCYATMIPSTLPVEPQLVLRAKSKQRPPQQGAKSKSSQMIVAMTARGDAQNLPAF